MKTFVVLFLLGIWRKHMLSSQNKIMAYLRTRPHKIMSKTYYSCNMDFFRGKTSMLLNEMFHFLLT